VEKQMAGVYNYLPLGLRTFRKIENIIREEINAIGGQEILMPVLQSKELWQQTGRWSSIESIMYQFKDHHGSEIGLGTTHEEVVTDIVKKHIVSYKDLPLALYQIQTKFRDEKRAKSGLLRDREFVMKDLYSFHTNEADLDQYYQKAHDAYIRIFKRLGLEAFSVEASGGAISEKFSHEFMVINPAGEDVTILCTKCGWAQNTEIAKVKAGDKCPKCGNSLQAEKTVEAGNIFNLGTEYSAKMGLKFTDQDGKQKNVIMGCYGIGLGRAMGTIVEASYDDDGIIWTKNTSPYQVHLLDLGKDAKKADKIYDELVKNNIDVLYDDRDISAGKKLKDADLIGICWQLIHNDKKETLELVHRQDHKKQELSLKEVIDQIKEYYQ
jgi:prolyl-tRNA synthetase